MGNVKYYYRDFKRVFSSLKHLFRPKEYVGTFTCDFTEIYLNMDNFIFERTSTRKLVFLESIQMDTDLQRII